MMCRILLICIFVHTVSADGWSQLAAQPSSSDGEPSRNAAPIVGGRTRMNLTDPAVRRQVNSLANLAMTSINRRSNSLYRQSVIRIQGASTQIVSGVLYHITFYSGQSTCRNSVENETLTLAQCPVSNEQTASFQQCTAKIWEQKWLEKLEMTDFKCAPVERQVALASSFTVSKKMQFGDLLTNDDGFDVWPLFRKFLQDYNKTYEDDMEMKRRYQIFRVNMKTAQMLQANEKGSAKYGATIFADMTPDEFTKNLLSPEWKYDGYPPRIPPMRLDPIPDRWDWREKNVVTPVKNQGMCGSCWAFCTTGNIEGVWAKKTGKLVSLSEQQLVDCDVLDEACNGGLPSNAYKEILRMGGLESEGDYPYKGSKKQCHLNRTAEAAYINSSIALPQDEKQMVQYLYKNGPLAIGINANPLMFYFGGIAHPWKFLCSPQSINHGVTIVGYGVQGDKPYWLIKNSWGRWWGESGYFRLYRGEGVCGVDQMATSVIID